MTEAILNIGVKSSGVVEAGKALDELSDASDRAEKSTKGLEFSMGLLKGALGALSIGAVVAGFKNTADAWSDMQSRVGAAVKNMDAAPRLMQRMVDIANASYSPLSQTVEVYSRNVSVLGALGKTANEAADFTEALNHALVITATKGQQAESVQNALAKAMAVGKLQADGLETVLANGGRVAELLAAQLGTTVNGLRQMATDGKITGDVIATSLIGNLEALREQAAEMPATIGDAFVRIQTNLLETIGSFDQTVGASGALAEVLIMVADNMDRIVTTSATAAVAFGTYYVGGLVAAAVATGGLTGALHLLRIAIAGTGIGLIVIAAGELIYQFMELVKKAGGFGNALGLLKDVAIEVWDRINLGGIALVGSLQSVWESMKAGFLSALAIMQKAWADFLHSVGSAAMNTPGMEGIGVKIKLAAVDAGSALHATEAAIKEAEAAAISFGDAAVEAGQKAIEPLKSIEAIRKLMDGEDSDDPSSGGGTSGALGASGGKGGKGKDEKSRGAKRLAREMEQRLEVLRTGLMTEEEERLAAYARDLETLDWHLANKKITEDEYNALRLQAERDLQDELQQIRLMGYASALSSVGDMMGSMAAIMGGNNEKMLKAQRIFAAASALIDTYAGAAKALTLPFPANLAAAAAILAKGMALVAAIRSGSKSASSGGGGGGGGSTAQAAPKAPPQKTQAVEINLHGEVFTKQSVADLMNKMNENLADGFQLHIRTT